MVADFLQVSGPRSLVSGVNGDALFQLRPGTRDLGPRVSLYGFTDSAAEFRPNHRFRRLYSTSDINLALSAL